MVGVLAIYTHNGRERLLSEAFYDLFEPFYKRTFFLRGIFIDRPTLIICKRKNRVHK